jgi:hypothetical protein
VSAKFTISRTYRFARSAAGVSSALLIFVLAPVASFATSTPIPVVTFAAAPLASGAVTSGQDAALNSVSCSGLNTCVAVGSFRTASGNQLLVSNEVNGVWSSGARIVLPHDAVSSFAHPSAPITQFSSVSCVSLGNCVAVGTYLTVAGFEPLISVEKAAVWSNAFRATLPAKSATSQQSAELFSVSCSSLGNCQAVGTYSDVSGGQLPLVLEENSSVWSSGFEPAMPIGALSPSEQSAELTSISCWSVANCSAVGAFVNAQGFETFVLNETNGKWATSAGDVTVSLPPDAASLATSYGNALNAISCSDATHCVAVGDYFANGVYRAMFTVGFATTWAQATSLATPTVPNATGEIDASLNAISCTSATWCVALGDAGSSTVRSPESAVFSVDSFTAPVLGALPKDSAIPTVASDGGAGCFAPNDCVVVGAYATSAHTMQGFVATPTTVPTSPQSLAGVPGNQKVHLQWSAPLYSGGLSVTAYIASATPGTASCTTAGALSCTVNGLTNGVEYHFRVVAQNSLGPSVSSGVAALTPRTVPSAPSIKSITPQVGALKVLINPPSSNGGATVTSYQYSISGGSSWHVRSTGTTNIFLTISGLTRHRQYRVAIRAMNVAGPSLGSKVVKATTR